MLQIVLSVLIPELQIWAKKFKKVPQATKFCFVKNNTPFKQTNQRFNKHVFNFQPPFRLYFNGVKTLAVVVVWPQKLQRMFMASMAFILNLFN